MTMNKLLILALAAASTATLLPAHAQTYQWKDAAGRTIISDSPPPATSGARAIGARTPAVVKEGVDDKTAAEPRSTAEKDMEFRKRQQEAREKAGKAEKEQAAAREKQENCDRARRNLATLESQQPVASVDDQGQRQLMGDEQRTREIEQARRYIAETCAQ